MWKHKTKYKGQLFLGNYELDKSGKRRLSFKNKNTGREVGNYGNAQQAKKEGWVKL